MVSAAPGARPMRLLFAWWCWCCCCYLPTATVGALDGTRRGGRALPTGITPSTLDTLPDLGDYIDGVSFPPRKKAMEMPEDELRNIFSVSCLKAKQLDPKYPCSGLQEVSEHDLQSIGKAPTVYPLDMGNFPHWTDARCNSDGAFLCDPDGLLKPKERWAVARALKQFREKTLVTCGQLDEKITRNDDEISKRHFNLAVLVLGIWPVIESDPASLQQLGRIVASRWGLVPIYNGVDAANPTDEFLSRREYTSNCPNAAVLIVQSQFSEVALSAPSCEFICNERGGHEVTTAVEYALRRGAPLGEAISAGIEEVAAVLDVGLANPMTMAEAEVTRDRRLARAEKKRHERFLNSDAYAVGVQRLILAGILGTMVFALGAFLYFNCSQPQRLTLRKLG